MDRISARSSSPSAAAEPTILHADLDSFYASVEQRDNPDLRGRPVVVGGGVVLAASYEARAYGVRTAMGGRQARRLCPGLIEVAPRFSAYVEASRAVFAILRDTSPVVEALSIDEAFLDARGLEHISGTPVEIAQRLRQRVREEVGLPITVGLATSKFLAKVASGVGKPDGLLVVAPGKELAFLHPLPVERLWGVGAVTATKLHGAGIRTVGEIAALGEAGLIGLLGPGQGRHLYALARARDPRRVRPAARRRSIGAQRALGSRPRPWPEIAASLMGLVDKVARRLREADRLSRTVVLRLRFGDYTRATRSCTLKRPTGSTPAIAEAALTLLRAARPEAERRGLTLVGVALMNLVDGAEQQLLLPFDRSDRLDLATDDVRRRFGSALLTRGSLVGTRLDEGPPILRE